MSSRFKPRMWLRNAFSISRLLTGFLILALLLGGITIIASLIDSRVITGAPAWFKPIKFAISLSIYSATVLWLLRLVNGRRRLVQLIAATTAISAFVELGIIILQVVRGTTSHFNISTSLDTALFSTMGVFVVLLATAAILLAFVVGFQRFSDPVLGWSVRLALLLTVFGMALGGLMLKPTPAQLAAASGSVQMLVSGAPPLDCQTVDQDCPSWDGVPSAAICAFRILSGYMRYKLFCSLVGY